MDKAINVKSIVATLAITAFLLLGMFSITNATGNDYEHTEKINICHATESESNPYEAIRVADDGNWNGHEDHEGDFLYQGPVDDKNRPDKEEGDQWCEDNQPKDEEPTPEATPPAQLTDEPDVEIPLIKSLPDTG